jgi:hypothetical protein
MYIIDPEFAPEIAKYKWYLSPHGYWHRNVLKGQTGPRRMHRFIWWLKHGSCPPTIDHVNRVRGDNRLENLRPANPTLNSQNMTTRYGGVKFHRLTHSPCHYQANIGWRGKCIYLGSFETRELAREYYDSCKAKIVAYEEAVSRGESPEPPAIERRRQPAERRGRPLKARSGVRASP